MNDQTEPSYARRLVHEFEALALGDEVPALARLREYLRHRDAGTYEKHIIPRLACKALLQHGPSGVREMVRALSEAPGVIYPNAIIEALWFAAKGEFGADMDGAAESTVLHRPLNVETIHAAKMAIRDVIAESRADDELFWQLLNFTSSSAQLGRASNDPSFMHDVRLLFAEATIKLTPSLLDEFRTLIGMDLPEESYQQFLADNPVLLDPLAAEVIPKQRMGLEHVTDFALRRLDERWVLVEIEKPQDLLFTRGSDFTAAFTHAFGQVIDFQRWVEDHGAYAQDLMKGIASPRGLLVIGRRGHLTADHSRKLERFTKNSSTIDVLTFDDVLLNAEALYRNLYYRPLEG